MVRGASTATNRAIGPSSMEPRIAHGTVRRRTYGFFEPARQVPTGRGGCALGVQLLCKPICTFFGC